MLENEFNSIEDIDRALEEEFKEPEETDEVTEEYGDEPEETDEETQDESAEETDEEEPSTDEEGLEVEDEKPQPHGQYTKEQKTKYAFTKMQHENTELRKANDENNEFLNALAQASGYADVNAMKEVVLKNIQAKEAEKQGISPEVYEKINNQQREIEALKQKEIQATQELQLGNFKKALDNVVNEYGFSEEDVREMFNELEADGYTLETLVAEPNPKFIIKGAFGDKIFSAKQQKALAKEKKATLDTTRMDTNASIEQKTLDEEIDEEMRAYAKENGYYYE